MKFADFATKANLKQILNNPDNRQKLLDGLAEKVYFLECLDELKI